MLNKLKFYKQQNFSDDLSRDSKKLEELIVAYYKRKNIKVSLKQNLGGTLGQTFFISFDGKSVHFLKSHIEGSAYRDALTNEFNIMKEIYSDKIFLQMIEVEHGRNFILMDVLDGIDTILPETAMCIINSYSKTIKEMRIDDCSSFYDISDLLHAAIMEVPVLYDNKLMSKALVQKIEIYLSQLKAVIPNVKRCICHGDLSDKNIMSINNETVVIDWEDAFYGIDGYDYLYWLTFFNHRKYYSDDFFEKLSTEFSVKNIELYGGGGGILSVFILILVIKSAVSFYSGAYKMNKVSVEDRILEFVNFLER